MRPSWDDVDEIERASHFQQKTRLTIFFNGTDEYKIAILPDGQKMDGRYFMECVLGPFTEVCCPEGRKSRKRTSCHILTVRQFTTLRRFKDI
jgi:hypothetical protein